MAMASAVCCCGQVRPIASSGGASSSVEQVPAGGVIVAESVAPPTSHSVTIFDRQRRVIHEFPVAENQYILQAAESHNVQLPFSCRQGCCTSCAVRIRSGQLYQPEALGISSVLKDKGYGLLCVGYALSDLELETQDEDEVYLLQFGLLHGRGTILWTYGGALLDVVPGGLKDKLGIKAHTVLGMYLLSPSNARERDDYALDLFIEG